MSQLDIEADHIRRQYEIQAAAATYYYVKTQAAPVATRIMEPMKVPNVPDGEAGPRINFVWECYMLVDDVGENINAGDQIVFSSGKYTGQKWVVSDVSVDALDYPEIRAEVVRGP